MDGFSLYRESDITRTSRTAARGYLLRSLHNRASIVLILGADLLINKYASLYRFAFTFEFYWFSVLVIDRSIHFNSLGAPQRFLKWLDVRKRAGSSVFEREREREREREKTTLRSNRVPLPRMKFSRSVSVAHRTGQYHSTLQIKFFNRVFIL